MRGGGAICPKPPQAEKLVQSHEAIAQEVAPFGIKVQTINPGAYLTGYNETMADTAFRWLDAEKKLTKSAELLLLGLRLKIKYPQILDSAREGSIRQSLPSTALSVGRFACCRCQCLAEIIEIPGSFYVVVCDHHLGVFSSLLTPCCVLYAVFLAMKDAWGAIQQWSWRTARRPANHPLSRA